MRTVLGSILFSVGLGLIFISRLISWDKETNTWKNGRGPGDTDWRYAIPGIVSALAGMIVLG